MLYFRQHILPTYFNNNTTVTVTPQIQNFTWTDELLVFLAIYIWACDTKTNFNDVLGHSTDQSIPWWSSVISVGRKRSELNVQTLKFILGHLQISC